MKFNDIIRAAMEDTGTLQQDLGEKLGLKQNSVSSTITRPNISLNKFVTVMEALGYDIIVRPKDGEKEMTITNE